jgi:hypothetical protein
VFPNMVFQKLVLLPSSGTKQELSLSFDPIGCRTFRHQTLSHRWRPNLSERRNLVGNFSFTNTWWRKLIKLPKRYAWKSFKTMDHVQNNNHIYRPFLKCVLIKYNFDLCLSWSFEHYARISTSY